MSENGLLDRVLTPVRWIGNHRPALGVVTLIAASVGYEAGSVAAGDALDLLWLVPSLVLGVVMLSTLYHQAEGT